MQSITVSQTVKLDDLEITDGAELLVLLKASGTGEGKFGLVRELLHAREKEGKSCTSLEAYDLLQQTPGVFKGTLDKAWNIMLTGQAGGATNEIATPAVEDRIVAMRKSFGGRTLAEAMASRARGEAPARQTTHVPPEQTNAGHIQTLPTVPTIGDTTEKPPTQTTPATTPTTPTTKTADKPAPAPPANPPATPNKVGPQEPAETQQGTAKPGPQGAAPDHTPKKK